MDSHNVNYMKNTLSDYELLEIERKKRKAEIDQLRAENERLKEALRKIYKLYVEEEFSRTAMKMSNVAADALNEVTK